MFWITKSNHNKILGKVVTETVLQHNSEMQRQVKKFEAIELRSAEIRETIQVTNANLMLRLNADSTSGDGNPYKTHAEQVAEIMSEYYGETDIGSDLVKRVINISAALKVPNGLAVETTDVEEGSAERKYIEDFIEVNQLNEGLCTELSKEGEKQGQVLTNLLWDTSDNQVKIRYMPWDAFKYEVRPIGLNNMTPPYLVSWDDVENTEVKSGQLSSEEIAFVAFNMQFKTDDQLRLIIEGSPTLGNVLHRIDDIGYDLIDWRQTNKLYAHPTPNLQCTDAEEAETIQGLISSQGWTTGNMMISSGKLTMVVPNNFFETLKQSIQINLQFVSGATGLSVGWLGFPDLMSNRAVSDSLGEPLEIVAANDITSWKSFYEQMFNNVIKIRNANIGEGATQLREGIVKPKLKPMSDRIWQQLIRLYLPSAEAGVMSRETFWNLIPGFNIEKERDNFKAQTKLDEESQLRTAEKIRKSNPDNRADTGQQATGSQRFNNERG